MRFSKQRRAPGTRDPGSDDQGREALPAGESLQHVAEPEEQYAVQQQVRETEVEQIGRDQPKPLPLGDQQRRVGAGDDQALEERVSAGSTLQQIDRDEQP